MKQSKNAYVLKQRVQQRLILVSKKNLHPRSRKWQWKSKHLKSRLRIRRAAHQAVVAQTRMLKNRLRE